MRGKRWQGADITGGFLHTKYWHRTSGIIAVFFNEQSTGGGSFTKFAEPRWPANRGAVEGKSPVLLPTQANKKKQHFSLASSRKLVWFIRFTIS